MSGVRPCVAALTGTAAVDTHTRELAIGHTAREQMSESQWIDLALARGSMRSTERIAGAVIDVLIVQEDDDALRYGALQGRGSRWEKRSPAGSGRPERRGRLLGVYLTSAGEQVHLDRTRVTIHAGTSIR